LAAQFMIPWLLRYPLADLTNGSRPLDVPAPTLGPLNFGGDNAMYYIVIPLSVLLMLAARNIMRTRVGRAFISVRDNDLAAELLGINVFVYKLQAFFLSALYAGIAGALVGYESQSLSLDKFSLALSIELLAMLVIGGAGFPLGPLFGVAFVNLVTQDVIPNRLVPALGSALPTLLPFIDPVNISASLSPLLFGLILVIFLIIVPRGIAHRWEIFKIAWKIRPYSH
jgi:branched-chain amino acid transport system permease protein